MEIIIGIIVGLAIGFFVGKLMEGKKAGEEKTQLIAKAQVLAANIDQSNQHHASELQSLTAYTDALAAETDEERERLMKSHAQSVRKHIDELAEKDYSKLVEDAIGFVLMFIPNETSYIAAMKQQPDLSRYAYQKKIIIISPSNLLMALQLAYNLWQYDRQNKNVEKIVKTAADLYDKVATFEDTFTSIGDLLTRLSGTYDKAKKQLYDGTGNVMRRVESLKNLGVTPKKQIKALEE